MKSQFVGAIKRFRSEAHWLRTEFAESAAHGGGRNHQLACEMAVVRLHDSWARFCRELIVISAHGNTYTLSGFYIPLSTVMRKRSDVMPYLLSTYKKRQYEPKWSEAVECLDAATRLKIVNHRTVAAALSSSDSPADEIRHVRNFYAHRKHGAAQRACSTGLFSIPFQPSVFELAAFRQAGKTVVDCWFDSLVIIAESASQ